VDVDIRPDASTTKTHASRSASFVTAKENSHNNASSKHAKKTRLRFVIPPDTTPAARTLLNIDDNGNWVHGSDDDDAQVGDIIEVCPEGMMLVQDIASRIHEAKGAAIIVDYGSDKGTGDTLRAFSRHEQVNVLSYPGQVDVTADVDFHALKKAVEAHNTPSCKAYGSVTQGQFLTSMGAADRVIQLIERDDTTDEQAQELFNALERLILPQHMGERYQVLALSSCNNANETPPGFSQYPNL